MQHIFGPVPSRRLGRSLGIDIIPYKTCTFDCVYCECGATTDKTFRRREFFPPEEILAELESRLSEIPGVREQMVARQQEMARGGGVVMEGRDIQTVVLPDAEVKIFLTASAETRARRRWLELKERGDAADLQQILTGIKARDERDSNRAHSPLRAAAEAVRVDTSDLSIEEVVAAVLEVVQGRLADSG